MVLCVARNALGSGSSISGNIDFFAGGTSGNSSRDSSFAIGAYECLDAFLLERGVEVDAASVAGEFDFFRYI